MLSSCFSCNILASSLDRPRALHQLTVVIITNLKKATIFIIRGNIIFFWFSGTSLNAVESTVLCWGPYICSVVWTKNSPVWWSKRRDQSPGLLTCNEITSHRKLTLSMQSLWKFFERSPKTSQTIWNLAIIVSICSISIDFKMIWSSNHF